MLTDILVSGETPLQNDRLAQIGGTNPLELALWGTPVGLWDWEVVHDRLTWVNDWCAHTQVTAFAGEGHERFWSARIHPADLPLYQRTISAHVQGVSAPYEVEYRLRAHVDEWVWILERGRAIERDSEGRAVRIVGLCMDVTDRHRSAEALEKSRFQFEVAVWGTSVGFWELDVSTNEVYWWNDWCGTMHLARCQQPLSFLRWQEGIHPDDIGPFIERHDHVVSGAAPIYEVEYRVQTEDGRWRWILTRARAVIGADGRVNRLVGIAMDIDVRRRAEDSLRIHSTILKTMREAVALIGKDQRIEYCNPAFGSMLQSIPTLMTGIAAAQSSANTAILDGGRSAAAPVPFVITGRPQSEQQVIGEGLSLAIEVQGETKQLVVVQDVSERRRLEAEIIDSTDTERRRLSTDLHDGIGQELTGIALMLRSVVSKNLTTDRDTAASVEEVIKLVNHVIQSTRQLAQGISPGMLDRGDLISGLQCLAERTRTYWPVDVTLQLKIKSDIKLSNSDATHLYLIAQEAIVNAAKHAQAKRIQLALKIVPATIQLSISDDGIGVPGSTPSANGMGMRIMAYRSSLIGGTLQIRRRPKGGTLVRFQCPLPVRSATLRGPVP